MAAARTSEAFPPLRVVLADMNEAGAQFKLGVIYDTGRVAPLASYRFAASDEQRARAIQNRSLVASMMTGAQIADARKRANKWKPI